MGWIKLVVAVALLGLIVFVAIQVAPPLIANFELQEDLHDLAPRAGARIGLLPQTSEVTEDSLQDAVIHKATEHGISLQARQVTVRQNEGSGVAPVYLEVRYRVRVNLLGYAFYMYFTPSSETRGFWSTRFGPVSRRG